MGVGALCTAKVFAMLTIDGRSMAALLRTQSRPRPQSHLASWRPLNTIPMAAVGFGALTQPGRDTERLGLEAQWNWPTERRGENSGAQFQTDLTSFIDVTFLLA